MDLMMLVPDNESQSTPRLEHVCEVPEEEDELLELIAGNTLIPRFRRWVVRQCMLSINHPGTRACMKSTASINYEKSRHIRSYPYMIHPFSQFRCHWETIIFVFTLLVLSVIPGLATFYFEEHEKLIFGSLIIDAVFLIDIVLRFLTGHYDYSTKVIVLDPRMVAHSWILSDYMKKKNSGIRKYIQSLNRAAIALTSSAHFLTVKTPEDVILNVILTVIGKIGLIYILGQVLQLITTLRSRSKGYSKLLQQLHEYMRYKELPLTIQRRILAYFDYTSKKSFEREKYIMTQVSSQLREELLFHNYNKFVENIKLFRHLPPQAITHIITSLRSEVFLTNDVIIKAGTPGDALFFIVSGTVAIYTSAGKEICHLENGAHFGEVALVMENEHRIATVVAIETCELYVITRDDFQKAIADFPNLLSKLQRLALEILDKAPVLEEAFGRDHSMPSNINISNIIYKRKE
ncbi:cyclic nucleotide-gated cation channel alpha-3 isoform X2 [Cephus cinctus]|uniref:Cyclic nucleotide-gated cation channel alpha-3 isoform X2 n=1 Tax=Cephus cinctus TaxID=211228 RepID=A0AAJ7RDA7_CEPCN|nr:cyclic nucleotide-gated cation channel alpha-3 isoform X2 [Cephus cinctus]